MLFVLVTGMPGSGKSVVSEVARELGIPVYTMGDVVREETLKRFGSITPELMVETSKKLREEHGEEVVAVRTAEKILRENPHATIVLVDGVRSPIEVDVFRRFGDVIVIAVHASPRTRYERLRKRGRPGDPIVYEDFARRDLTELSFGLGNVIALADYMIVNEGSIDEARELARRVLSSLVRGHGRDRC